MNGSVRTHGTKPSAMRADHSRLISEGLSICSEGSRSEVLSDLTGDLCRSLDPIALQRETDRPAHRVAFGQERYVRCNQDVAR